VTELATAVVSVILTWLFKDWYDSRTNKRKVDLKRQEDRLRLARSNSTTMAAFIREFTDVKDRNFRSLTTFESYRRISRLESKGHLKTLRLVQIEEVVKALHKEAHWEGAEPFTQAESELRQSLIEALEKERDYWKSL